MISRVLTAALAAGFLAAVVATLLQVFATTPLILKAETFERHASAGPQDRAVLILAHTHQGVLPDAAEPADEGWKPADGLSRAAFTGLATLVSGVGYALVLAALMIAVGADLNLATAVPWAIGGFLAVSLAPAMGLPPELPGMGGEHLGERQAWWLSTAAGTALGLYLIGCVRTRLAILMGLAVIVAPHVFGAPHGGTGGEVPATLAAQFAARSLAVAFVFWLTLGLGLAWAWERFAPKREGVDEIVAR